MSPCHLTTVSPRHRVTAARRHPSHGAFTAAASPLPHLAGSPSPAVPLSPHPPAPGTIQKSVWGAGGGRGGCGGEGVVHFYSHRGKNGRVKSSLYIPPSGERPAGLWRCSPAAARGHRWHELRQVSAQRWMTRQVIVFLCFLLFFLLSCFSVWCGFCFCFPVPCFLAYRWGGRKVLLAWIVVLFVFCFVLFCFF